MLHIRENLSDILIEKGLSVRELERRSGLKEKTIQNIMQGKSENPSVKTVSKIAKELGYTIEQLISEASVTNDTDFGFNFTLYNKVSESVKEYIIQNSIRVSFDDFVSALSEIYCFSCENNNEEVDEKFTKWWLKKHLAT